MFDLVQEQAVPCKVPDMLLVFTPGSLLREQELPPC